MPSLLVFTSQHQLMLTQHVRSSTQSLPGYKHNTRKHSLRFLEILTTLLSLQHSQLISNLSTVPPETIKCWTCCMQNVKDAYSSTALPPLEDQITIWYFSLSHLHTHCSVAACDHKDCGHRKHMRLCRGVLRPQTGMCSVSPMEMTSIP